MPHRIADGIALVAERISGTLGTRAMRLIARFHRAVTNPMLRRWVTRLPNMAVIEHRGRRSARRYETPVMAFVTGNDLLVVLNYGRNADWVQNLLAGTSASARDGGKRYRLNDVRVVPIDSPDVPVALRAMRTPGRFALRARLGPP